MKEKKGLKRKVGNRREGLYRKGYLGNNNYNAAIHCVYGHNVYIQCTSRYRDSDMLSMVICAHHDSNT